jgi:hypothetical protein
VNAPSIPNPHDHARIVNVTELGSQGADERHIENLYYALSHEETVFVAGIIEVGAHHISLVVDAAGEAGVRTQRAGWIQRNISLLVQQKGMSPGRAVIRSDDVTVIIHPEYPCDSRTRILKRFIGIAHLRCCTARQEQARSCDFGS